MKMISVTDKIKKLNAERLISIAFVEAGKEYELYYHFSDDSKAKIRQFLLKVKKRKGTKVESILPRYPNALIFEAEITEFTGIKFIGNELSGKRLFLAEGKHA